MSTNHDDQIRDPDSVVVLRGAAPASVGRGFWRVVTTLVLAVLAVVLVVSFVSAVNDRARLERLTHHGIEVNAVIDTCIGNLGGSGSNASSYTCHASYLVRGRTYDEVVGRMSSFASPGTRVAVVADPARPSTIELAAAVAAARPSNGGFVIPGVLALILVSLTTAFVRRSRRSPIPAPLSKDAPHS